MPRSPRALAAPLFAAVFGLGGCGLAAEDAAPSLDSAPTAADPWMAEVTARIRDAAHGFTPDGDAFVAGSPEHGITAWFDAGGAVLQREGDSIEVRTTGWGRAGAMGASSAASPGLGACVPGREDPEGECVRRLEYADAGLTEWWAGGPEGFEQGWWVSAPPAGEGALAIDVGIEGATVTVAEGEVWVDGDGGELWIVSGLVAWDADGTPLDARFERAEGGLRVTVDDADARYPIEIDPVYTTASTTLTGEAYSFFGISVSGVGDVNGDGYDDVIVGAPGYGSATGRAYVYAGSASGVSTTASTTLTGEGTDNQFGSSVSGAGDVNGDDYDDVIVGAFGYDSFTGRAYVYAGSASGVSTIASTTLTGEGTNDAFGHSVSGAGDVNGDDYDDLIVGAWRYSSETGRAYVYAGSASGLSTMASTTLTGEDTGDLLGFSVSGAGDVNGDGYDDVIVGVNGIGRAYVYVGSASGLSTTASTTLTGEGTNTEFGSSVSGAGDVNGDDYDDVIVGAYYYESFTGRAYVYAGSASGVSSTASTTLTGEGTDNWFGLPVSGAGDVNGDGYNDVMVGAYVPARAYVHLGYGSPADETEGRGCGCATTTSGTGLAWSLVLGVLALAVRRRAA